MVTVMICPRDKGSGPVQQQKGITRSRDSCSFSSSVRSLARRDRSALEAAGKRPRLTATFAKFTFEIRIKWAKVVLETFCSAGS